MLTVDEAKKIVEDNSKLRRIIKIPVEISQGFVLAEDISAPLDLPSFNQSAMDGYGLFLSFDAEPGDSFELVGEIKAGDLEFDQLRTGEAMRIFTGAFVPDTINTIVIQEHIQKEGNRIVLQKPIRIGANIRKRGEQIKEGTLALSKGTLITPGAISFLCSLGLTEIDVFYKPVAGIVLTGNELVSPGDELLPGQIYESNSFALKSVLKEYGFDVFQISKVQDEYQKTYDALKKMLEQVDVLIVSGGISVGDYDFVGKALREMGVKELFYKVRQKPGKPLFFGKLDDRLVFALPGNPASALVCYYQYVLPSMNLMAGRAFEGLKTEKISLKHDYVKKGDRAEFLKARKHANGLEILEGQLSHMMHTFAISDGLVYIPLEANEIKQGQKVLFYEF